MGRKRRAESVVGSAGLSTSTDGRWAPFPVQDWSTMPTPESVWSSPPGIAGGVAAARPRRWLPWLVVLVMLALVAGGIFVADRQGRVAVSGPAQRYVPGDGAVGYGTRTFAGTAPETVVTESARYVAGQINAGLDSTLAVEVIGAVDGVVADKTFWRTTTTELTSYEKPQETRVYLLADGVRLLAESWAGHGLVFHPGLLELPSDVAVGSRWSGEGTAGPDLTYASSFRAEPGAGACVRVTGRIRLTDADGQSRPTREVERTWCPGAGIVSSNDVIDGLSTSTGPLDRIGTDDTSTTSQLRRSWSDLGEWLSQDLSSVSVDPTFGEGPITGVAADLPPLMTDSGVLYRVSGGAEDLVAFRPQDERTWRSLWRLHPGGRVLAVASFGDVVVATTSLRQTVAYSARGARLWSMDLDELAFSAPVRLSPDSLVLVDRSGRITAADIASGEILWQTDADADVGAAPVVVAGAVLINDGNGRLSAYDGADGSRRWQIDIDTYHGAAAAGAVALVVDDQAVEAIGIDDGRRRWIRPYEGTYALLTGVGGAAVLSSRSRSWLVGADGTMVRLPRPYTLVTPGAGQWVGWGKERADVVDAAGRLLTGRDIPRLAPIDPARAAVATPTGVLSVDWRWQVQTWGEPG